jgi:hypothetical protein
MLTHLTQHVIYIYVIRCRQMPLQCLLTIVMQTVCKSASQVLFDESSQARLSQIVKGCHSKATHTGAHRSSKFTRKSGERCSTSQNILEPLPSWADAMAGGWLKNGQASQGGPSKRYKFWNATAQGLRSGCLNNSEQVSCQGRFQALDSSRLYTKMH